MVPPDELWLKGVGTPIRVQLREWSEDPAEIEAMAATYSVYNLEHHDALVRPFDGIVSAVQRLKEVEKADGLVTSKVRNGAIRGLELIGLEPAFDVIVGADDVRHPKPHPEPVLTALAQLGAEPDEAVFIGDSRHDLVCGRAAGVKTAAALWGPFDRAHLADLEPDYRLNIPRGYPHAHTGLKRIFLLADDRMQDHIRQAADPSRRGNGQDPGP